MHAKKHSKARNKCLATNSMVGRRTADLGIMPFADSPIFAHVSSIF